MTSLEILLLNLGAALFQTVLSGIDANAKTEEERQAKLKEYDARLAAALAKGPIPPV